MMVSIIIPNYNNSIHLEDCIESCLTQKNNLKDIIIVDDHSTDNSWSILEKYSARYPELIKIFRNKGKGACSARNYGYKLSGGKYIQYLDSDDLLGPGKIEKQVKALEKQGMKISVCETWNFNHSISEAKNTDAPYLFSTDQPEHFLINLWGGNELPPNMIQTGAWLTPRVLVKKAGPWDESLSKDQDGEFFARVAMCSQGIVYVPRIKNFYRKHLNGSNIASQRGRSQLQSQLSSMISKERSVGSRINDLSFCRAMAIQYKFLGIDAWPEFKDISELAIKKSDHFGGCKELPVLGGRLIEGLKDIFGWRTARSVSFYAHNSQSIKAIWKRN